MRDRCHRRAVRPAAGAVDRVDRHGGEAELLGCVDDAGTAAARVFHLVVQLLHLLAGALLGEVALQAGRHAGVVRLLAGFDLGDFEQHGAELSLHRLADFVQRQRERSRGDLLIEHLRLADLAEIEIGRLDAALLGEVGEAGAAGDLGAGRLGLFDIREHDLQDLALLRRRQLVLALLEQLLRVGVRHLGPLGDRFRRHHQERDLAILGGAELRLVRVVERGEVGGRGRRDGAGLRVSQLQIVDRALLVLKLAQRLHQRLRRLEAGGQAAGDLAAERDAALLGQIALLGEAELADQLLEAIGVELAVGALEVRILQDRLHGVGVGLAEPEPARVFVERGFGDGLLQHLAIDSDRARLIRGQRPAELAADLLQTVIVVWRNCSVEISVLPILASVDRPKPRNTSAIPQTPKLTIRTPITIVMMVLPIQLDEALRIPRSMESLFVRREPAALGQRGGQTSVAGLKIHHKVPSGASQPQPMSRSVQMPSRCSGRCCGSPQHSRSRLLESRNRLC